MRIVLVCTDPNMQMNGHERVGVSAGGEDEAHWKSLGYVPEEVAEPEPPATLEVEPEDAPEFDIGDLRKEFRRVVGKPPGRRTRETMEAAIAEAGE